ncbi:putative intraflagellar transport protein ift88 [Blattamonas nauphoetae]|uniref:Intraflagellar transport protein ift88 n=1 Tax=Blattamonas nauphoetae TaxID=2049346 RepID=A0ABQ9X462_9EUKA|nr:putative intraflagellar transport protein ift88 [Blattamonas nauphoetae]
MQGAGYTNRPGTGNTGTLNNPLLQALSVENMFADNKTPEETLADMEQEISNLVEQSTLAALSDMSKALMLAKEAASQEVKASQYRELHKIGDPNLIIKFFVYFNLACALENNEQYDDALRTYNMMMSPFQNTIHASRLRVNMGNIHFKMKDYPQAIKNYQIALDNLSESNLLFRHKIRRNIAYTYLVQQQYDRAMQEYETLMKDHIDLPSAFNLVLCYRALGDVNLMQEGFQRLLSVDTAIKKKTQYNQGSFALEDIIASGSKEKSGVKDELSREMSRRQDKSARFIIQAAKVIIPVINPDVIKSYDYISEVLRQEGYPSIVAEIEMSKATECLQRGEIDRAIDLFKTFTRRTDDISGPALQNLSFIALGENDIAQAEQYAQQAVDQDPYNAGALVNLGNCKMKESRYEEALQLYTRALSSDSSNAAAQYNSGLACIQLERYNDALRFYTGLNKKYPQNTDVMLMLSQCYLYLNKQTDGLKWLSTVNARIPSDAGILCRLGEIASPTDEARALYYYQEAARYNPASIDIAIWLGRYFVKHYHFENAAPYFEQAIKIDPNPKYYILLASCYRKMEDQNKALSVFQEGHSKSPSNKDLLKYLISLCKELNKDELTREYESKLAALADEPDEADQRSGTADGAVKKKGKKGKAKTSKAKTGKSLASTSTTSAFESSYAPPPMPSASSISRGRRQPQLAAMPMAIDLGEREEVQQRREEVVFDDNDPDLLP